MSMTIVVTGASGRMGSEVLDGARERGMDAIAVSRTESTNADSKRRATSGTDAYHPDDLQSLLSEYRPDALVDFTVPEASIEFLDACVETGTPAVVGTTGFEAAELETIDRTSDRIPVLKAANFARGIQTLLALVRETAASLPQYDVELTETHHNGKRDAPSGTAKSLLEIFDEERVHGREGIQPRNEDEIGVHVRRAGNVRGEHELLFAGNDEVLTLTHRAESRHVFAAGALDAAEWVSKQKAGRYEFREVLA
ncbi:4-hydroxy-tetrahydrodipicolinate reductase [Halocatena marina]|uniref:4-hydroxy-tetrahydrodipicolinate reductase n=1 Tax=Halocatena marina TaxID=2934937 RepID=A0ABD5YRX1_9EURY|nr:4-hydroxy-tetrahydrodipicolinate reductase [Halocatena marina]